MTNTLKNIRENIADSQIERLKKELEQIDEGRFSQSQIDQLKKQFGPLKDKGEKNVVQMDKLAKMMSKYSPDHLLQLSTLDIPMVSKVAKALLAKKDKRFAESLIVGLNKSSAEYKAGKEAAKKGEKYDANPHEPGVKRLNWSTGHNDFRADALRKAGKPNYGARGQFEELVKEADLTKAQIKMVHKQADELPKNDFIKRYGKDGDAVRYATATNQIKKKLGIED